MSRRPIGEIPYGRPNLHPGDGPHVIPDSDPRYHWRGRGMTPTPMRGNGLTTAQIERLAILAEELGECQQCVGKILKYGFDSCHPDTGEVNSDRLAEELGDLIAAIDRLVDAGEVHRLGIEISLVTKQDRRDKYTYHQGK